MRPEGEPNDGSGPSSEPGRSQPEQKTRIYIPTVAQNGQLQRRNRLDGRVVVCIDAIENEIDRRLNPIGIDDEIYRRSYVINAGTQL